MLFGEGALIKNWGGKSSTASKGSSKSASKEATSSKVADLQRGAAVKTITPAHNAVKAAAGIEVSARHVVGGPASSERAVAGASKVVSRGTSQERSKEEYSEQDRPTDLPVNAEVQDVSTKDDNSFTSFVVLGGHVTGEPKTRKEKPKNEELVSEKDSSSSFVQIRNADVEEEHEQALASSARSAENRPGFFAERMIRHTPFAPPVLQKISLLEKEISPPTQKTETPSRSLTDDSDPPAAQSALLQLLRDAAQFATSTTTDVAAAAANTASRVYDVHRQTLDVSVLRRLGISRVTLDPTIGAARENMTWYQNLWSMFNGAYPDGRGGCYYCVVVYERMFCTEAGQSCVVGRFISNDSSPIILKIILRFSGWG